MLVVASLIFSIAAFMIILASHRTQAQLPLALPPSHRRRLTASARVPPLPQSMIPLVGTDTRAHATLLFIVYPVRLLCLSVFDFQGAFPDTRADQVTNLRPEPSAARPTSRFASTAHVWDTSLRLVFKYSRPISQWPICPSSQLFACGVDNTPQCRLPLSGPCLRC